MPDELDLCGVFSELDKEPGDTVSRAVLDTVVEARTNGDTNTDEVVSRAVGEGLLRDGEGRSYTVTETAVGDPGHAVEPDETGRRNGKDTAEGVGSSGEDTDVGGARPSGRSFYPDELLARDWWVNWVLAYRHNEVDDDGTAEEDATATKQPVAPYRRSDAEPVRWNFGLSDEEHPSTTFKTVEEWDGEKVGLDIHAPDRVISDEIGVGIIIPPEQEDRKITLLDWDDVRDPETGEVHPVAGAAIDEIDGYAEISQSGEGIHQFVFGEIPGGLKKFIRHVDDEPFVGDDLPMVEMYESGRLCAMTARHVEGSGEDVVEGQDLIDGLCWRFGTAGNNSTETPTDPFAHERDGGGEVPDHEAVDRAMREAREYNGEAVADWDIPDGRSLEYEAVLRARERSDELDGISNWKLNSFAGALGYHDGLTHEEVVEDLDAVCDDDNAQRESGQAHRKASKGDYPRPSCEMLVRRGILPVEVLATEGDEYEKIPLWALRKAAVALGVVDPEDFVEKETDDGDIYRDFPDGETRNETLKALEEEGIEEHGWEYQKPPRPDDPETEETPAGTADTPDNWVSKAGVKHAANLSEDDSISDLSDREKAACVWELIKKSPQYHVRVRRDNSAIWAYDEGVWRNEGERAIRRAAREAVGAMNYGENVVREVKAQAEGDPETEVEPDEFGVGPGKVAVRNGLLDLDAAAKGDGTDAVRELRPSDYALVRLPVEYDPEEGFDRWGDLVTEWAEPGRADALQEFVGYCLEVGRIPIHRALMLVGGGANGKSTFLHVVRELLGEDNITSTELQTLANERDAVAEFYGAIANINDDLSSRDLGKGVGMFKKMVAGDKVRGRELFEEGFDFTPTGKHLYAANKVPDVTNNVDDDDEAFWRRWLIVEFPNHYPRDERDTELPEKLTTEEALSGVLNWAMEGRRRLLSQGYFTGEYEAAYKKRDRWMSWGDAVDEFINEHVEEDEEADNVSTAYAYERFQAWAKENGRDTVGQQKFTETLRDGDVDVGYGTSVRVDGKVSGGYKKLGFSDDVPEASEDQRDDGQEGFNGFE